MRAVTIHTKDEKHSIQNVKYVSQEAKFVQIRTDDKLYSFATRNIERMVEEGK